MKQFVRYLIRVVICFPFAVFLAYLFSLIPKMDVFWFHVVILSFGGGLYRPNSVYAWEVILEQYEKSVQGLSLLVTEFGNFIDMDEDQNEGITIATSICDDGLILYRVHIITFLREVAVIPWRNIESIKIVDRTQISEDGLVDQDSDMVAEILIEGISATLEIPWNKEIEMFANLHKENIDNKIKKYGYYEP